MILKRILLVGKANLFTEGLEKLLTLQLCQSVTRIEPESVHALVAEVRRIQPNLVILNTINWKQHLAILSRLKTSSTLKIVVVNEYDNDMVIYEHAGSVTVISNDEKAKVRTLMDKDLEILIPRYCPQVLFEKSA